MGYNFVAGDAGLFSFV